MKNKPSVTLIVLFMLLTAVGWINIFSTVYQSKDFTMDSAYGMQLIWIASLWLIAIFVFVIGKGFYYHFAAYIYLIFTVLLVVVFFIGVEHAGAKSWLGIGRFGIQPAEFAKYGTCLLVSRYISSYYCDLSKWKHVWRVGIIILIPVGFILLQNDTGSALPFFFLVFALFREGLTPWILIFGFALIFLFVLLIYFPQWIIITAVTILFIMILIHWYRKKKPRIFRTWIVYIAAVIYIFSADIVYHKVLQDYQRQRIDLLFGKIDDPRGIGYNVNQAKIAIGSGDIFGKGWGKGTQTKLNFVPEQSTDFIFCTIGEEYGFIGTTTVILLYILFIGMIIRLSEKSKDTFTRCYGYCIASIFFAHTTINIGMTIGLMPVIGIPLPFISYGGSSLWAFTIMLFTFINLEAKVNRRRTEN
ncbi:MAG: rod shape-determining protein RodA [Bacteroidales bacterium]|jgi:rod shape determining protein RodA|nr:rod shape-determining protein RodA [Bacteroidales bacterium]